MTRLFLFILLCLSSGPAFADWMSLGESDSGTTVYADPTTMRREGDLVKMLVLFDFKAVRTKEGVSYSSAKAQMDYDCAEQRYEGLAVMYFSGNMGNGQLLDRSSGNGKRLRISPGSLDHDLWKLACGKK
jgi:surface-adhesin protein E